MKRTMAHMVNLHVIEMIFEDHQVSSVRAKYLYLKLLMRFLKEKPARVGFQRQFTVLLSDIPEVQSLSKELKALDASGLIVIDRDTVTFNNVWSPYIEWDALEKVAPEQYLAGFRHYKIDHFKEDIQKANILKERVCIKSKISEDDYWQLVTMFYNDQLAFDTKYATWSDVTRHIAFWIEKNKERLPKIKQQRT